jgi:F0F1-type ATP synthase assembly protein I
MLVPLTPSGYTRTTWFNTLYILSIVYVCFVWFHNKHNFSPYIALTGRFFTGEGICFL